MLQKHLLKAGLQGSRRGILPSLEYPQPEVAYRCDIRLAEFAYTAHTRMPVPRSRSDDSNRMWSWLSMPREALIQSLVAVHHGIERERFQNPMASVVGQAQPFVRAGAEAKHVLGQAVRVTDRKQEPGFPILDHFGVSA